MNKPSKVEKTLERIKERIWHMRVKGDVHGYQYRQWFNDGFKYAKSEAIKCVKE
jgi:hypothetical protein